LLTVEWNSSTRKTFHQTADERDDIGQQTAADGEVGGRVRVKPDVDSIQPMNGQG
jgi:hypothetical protein